jgi:hypothetical protein
MAHQDELEAQLAPSFSQVAPEIIGNTYLVPGTIDKKVGKEGLAGGGGHLGEMLQHVADFKRVLKLAVEPGGWYPAEREQSP